MWEFLCTPMGEVPAFGALGMAGHHGPEPHAAEQPSFFWSQTIKSLTSKGAVSSIQAVDLLKLVRKHKQRTSAKEARKAATLEKRKRTSKAQGPAKQLLTQALVGNGYADTTRGAATAKGAHRVQS